VYADFFEGLRQDFGGSAAVFDSMRHEESEHRRRLIELYQQKFGEHIPLIRRQDVKGFVQRTPVWLVRPLGLDTVRKQASAIEVETRRFYEKAAGRTQDASIRQLLDVYEFYGASVVALMEVPGDAISSYGAVDAEPVSHNSGKDRLFRIRNMVEKPKPSEAPSNLAIIGRYVLTPEVFQSIEAIEPGSGGEIQLTDALKHLLRNRPIYGYRFEGTRYDAGDKLGFLKATVEFALHRHDLGGPFREYLKQLKL